MKQICILILLCIGTTVGLAQKLPDKIADQPGGITITYFNTLEDPCMSEVFITADMNIYFPCYDKNYRRVDISAARAEIKEIKEILNFKFIDALNKCCDEKGCTDTIHGYFLMIKRGKKNSFIYIDIAYTEANKCGNAGLKRLVELFQKIKDRYK